MLIYFDSNWMPFKGNLKELYIKDIAVRHINQWPILSFIHCHSKPFRSSASRDIQSNPDERCAWTLSHGFTTYIYCKR